MEWDNMTREELVEYIQSLQKKRAFTYEDQMKLAILDESPFTIWTSDRDRKITFWSGKCEALYGYSAEEVIGRDYIPLFVAPDERAAAQKDHLKIIDENEVFHNIANDAGKNGNVLHLITNCRRIKDPVSGAYLNAEMGLIIDYYEDEKEHLNQIIAESRKIKSCINQFDESTAQYKEQFVDRKKSLKSAIREVEKNAIRLRKRTEFQEKIAGVNEQIETIEEELERVTEEYCSAIHLSISYEQCEKVRQEFMDQYNAILDNFENVVLDFEEISNDYDWDAIVVTGRDALMTEIATRNKDLIEYARTLLMDAEAEVVEYKSICGGDDSKGLQERIKRRDIISANKKAIDDVADKYRQKAMRAQSQDDLSLIREEMQEEFCKIEAILKEQSEVYA